MLYGQSRPEKNVLAHLQHGIKATEPRDNVAADHDRTRPQHPSGAEHQQRVLEHIRGRKPGLGGIGLRQRPAVPWS